LARRKVLVAGGGGRNSGVSGAQEGERGPKPTFTLALFNVYMLAIY
jgi:hypothetical protein